MCGVTLQKKYNYFLECCGPFYFPLRFGCKTNHFASQVFAIFHFHSAHPTICVCMSVRHHFEDDHYFCSSASQTLITIHILKAYDVSYSKIIGGRKYKDKYNDKDSDKEKDTDKVPEKPNICYIFEILTTYSFQI